MWQPHATFLVSRLKPYETRPNPKNPISEKFYGHTFVVYAAMRRPPRREVEGLVRVLTKWQEEAALPTETKTRLTMALLLLTRWEQQPYGAMLGTCVVEAPKPSAPLYGLEPFGDFSPGRWAFPVTKIKLFPEPVPFKAPHQGTFFWDAP